MEYEDAVAQAQQLVRFGRPDQDGHALGGKFADDLVDFGLGAYIDAARRVVEKQQPRPQGQPLGEDDLLLVARR